ncbi:kinase-like domain-containing protein [Blastocladiella britannica]|nr:kinase-like domain-containing protein [Blastocladiella britannica]
MGNTLARDYDIAPAPVATGGPAMCWRVHPATHRTTKRACAVFLLEKKLVTPKQRLETLLALARRDVATLCRLRHPALLEIVEPIAESPTQLAFATEPVLTSLANALGNWTNMPGPIRSHSAAFGPDAYTLDDLEILRGVLQLARALSFCHLDAKLVHGNLVPEAVYVNQRGEWKLSGFQFAQFLSYASSGSQDPNAPQQYPEHAPSPAAALALPNLDFSAPEYALQHTLRPESDLFALGCLVFALYNHGASPIRASGNLLTYKQQLPQLSAVMSTSSSPSAPVQLAADLCRVDPNDRTPLALLPSHAVFQSPLLAAVQFVTTTLPTASDLDKAAFLKRLAGTLATFPPRIVRRTILPALLAQLKLPAMVPFALPCVMVAAESAQLGPRDWTESVLPLLRPLFTVDRPAAIMMALLGHVPAMVRGMGERAWAVDGVPLMATALGMTGDPAVVALAARQLAAGVPPPLTNSTSSLPPPTGSASTTVMGTFDAAHIKTVLLPKLAALLAPGSTSSTPAVPELVPPALGAIHAAISHLDRDFITSTLLPTLRVASTAIAPGPHAATTVRALLAVYRSLPLPADGAAVVVAPALLRMAFSDAVRDATVFSEIMRDVRALVSAAEDFGTRKLRGAEVMAAHTSDALRGGSLPLPPPPMVPSATPVGSGGGAWATVMPSAQWQNSQTQQRQQPPLAPAGAAVAAAAAAASLASLTASATAGMGRVLGSTAPPPPSLSAISNGTSTGTGVSAWSAAFSGLGGGGRTASWQPVSTASPTGSLARSSNGATAATATATQHAVSRDVLTMFDPV